MSADEAMAKARGPTASTTKKSVALSGVIAGNTGVCSIGRTGKDCHYRGINTPDLAEQATF